jgi:methionyl-tRNA formyltransferase
VNLFLGTFDGVLEVMADSVGVDAVVSERGLLRNLRLQQRLRDQGVSRVELRGRDDFEAWLQRAEPVALCVVAGFSHILPAGFIERCRMIVNFHPGLVQQCRGPQPVGSAIVRGHREFGVTAHRIDSEAIDAGPIIAQRRLPIDYHQTYSANYSRLLAAMVSLAREVLPLFGQDDWPAGESWQLRPGSYFPRLDPPQAQQLARARNLLDFLPPATDLAGDGAELAIPVETANVPGLRITTEEPR